MFSNFKNEKSAKRGSFRAGYPADICRPKTSVRALRILENKHLGADIRDPKARTSTTLRDFQKLRSEKKNWGKFWFPKIVATCDRDFWCCQLRGFQRGFCARGEITIIGV